MGSARLSQSSFTPPLVAALHLQESSHAQTLGHSRQLLPFQSSRTQSFMTTFVFPSLLATISQSQLAVPSVLQPGFVCQDYRSAAFSLMVAFGSALSSRLSLHGGISPPLLMVSFGSASNIKLQWSGQEATSQEPPTKKHSWSTGRELSPNYSPVITDIRT